MGVFKDLTGQRFGRLVAVKRSHRKNKRWYWECLCDCGKTHFVVTSNLMARKIRSCGCFGLEGNNRKHSMAGTPIYAAWGDMKRRCLNKKDKRFHHYGGRGITVCPQWIDSFEAFYSHIGDRPSPKHSVDRINNDGSYEPGNVRWATQKEQVRNRRDTLMITYNGKTRAIGEWSDITGIHKSAIRSRIYILGWSVSDAIERPSRRKNRSSQKSA